MAAVPELVLPMPLAFMFSQLPLSFLLLTNLQPKTAFEIHLLLYARVGVEAARRLTDGDYTCAQGLGWGGRACFS